MRAHLVQIDIAWEDRKANFARARALLDDADVEPGDLIVLPEMFDTGFSMATERTADTDGATLRFLGDMAREFRATVQGGRTVAVGAMAHNRAPVLGPDGALIAEYAKIHPFTYGKEHERFIGGTEVVTYEWRWGAESIRVCPAICYDLRFPELFRLGLRRGAEVYAIGANWPEARQHHWRALLIARAIENQAVVLGVNRTGKDINLNYAGGTIAVSATGEVLGELAMAEGVLSLEADIKAARGWRSRFPAWRDSRLNS
ncbi:MAG: nitrilase-related carbon-nitrogen hydrolase [Phycisphaerales bacterium]